jgi:hypothetical protein
MATTVTEPHQWWDVIRTDPVFGIGKRIERIQAASYDAALKTAQERNGSRVLVTLATNATRYEPRRRAVDLGNMTRRKR